MIVMAFLGLFKRDYSRNFSENVVSKDYDRFARLAGIIVAPHMRERIIKEIFSAGPEEYPQYRRLLKKALLDLSLGRT